MTARLTGFRTPHPGRLIRTILFAGLAGLAVFATANARPPIAGGTAPAAARPGAATEAGTAGAVHLVKVQAQIVPLSDRSLALASAGGLPTPLATARAPGRIGVTLWDEIRIQPPAVTSANGVVTITVNGK